MGAVASEGMIGKPSGLYSGVLRRGLVLGFEHVILYTLNTVSIMAIQAVSVLTSGPWSTSPKEQINRFR